MKELKMTRSQHECNVSVTVRIWERERQRCEEHTEAKLNTMLDKTTIGMHGKDMLLMQLIQVRAGGHNLPYMHA